jgi:hypothetical protein
MAKQKIPLTSLAQYKHVKFLITTEKQAIVAYRFVMMKLVADLRKLMKKKKLAKSEDPSDGLEAGWTSDIPQIEVDLEALTAKVIDKYMSSLRWVLMGDFAGAEAKKAAESIGLKGKVTPGIVHAAYLQSLDSHAKHYEDVTGLEAPEMPTDLVKASFDQIAKRVGRFVDQTLAQLKLDVIGAVDRKIVDHNFRSLNEAHSEAHDALPTVGPTEAVAEAGGSISDVLSAKALTDELKRTADNFERKWDLAVRTDLAMASAAGTHQALLEIHGSDNPDVKVAWIEFEDERVCSFCKHASKNADGTHKLYKMADFQPSGYNYTRKRAEWKLAIPPAHPRCRCNLVYIPPGFKVDSDGSLSKK